MSKDIILIVTFIKFLLREGLSITKINNALSALMQEVKLATPEQVVQMIDDAQKAVEADKFTEGELKGEDLPPDEKPT